MGCSPGSVVRGSCAATRDGLVHGRGTLPSTRQPRLSESLTQYVLELLPLGRRPRDDPFQLGVRRGPPLVLAGYPGEAALDVLWRVSGLVEVGAEPRVQLSEEDAANARRVLARAADAGVAVAEA